MAKYEWYFVNKDGDVCKHVTYKITFIISISAYFKPFNFIHGPKHFFFKFMLISYLTYRLEQKEYHSILKKIFSMELSKANTVRIVKNSPSLRTTRKTLQFYRACSGFFFFPRNGRDNKPSHPLLLELPYLRIKPMTQSQQAKK